MPCHVPATSVSSRRRALYQKRPPTIAAKLDLSKPGERSAHDFLLRATSGCLPLFRLLSMNRRGSSLLVAIESAQGSPFVLSLSLVFARQLPASLFGFLLRLGRGSLFAYAVHIPLCYSRLAQPVQGKLTMKEAMPLLLGLIALTWLAVRIKDSVQTRLTQRKTASATTIVLLMLASSTALAQPATQKDTVQQSESVALAQELAASGRAPLAYALHPIDSYRAQVTLPDDFSIKSEVERSHQLFQSGQFRESADSYALLLVARPDLTRVLFNIAQGLRRAGDDRFALGFYRRYLQVDPSTPLRAEVEGYIRELATVILARAQAQNRPPTPIHKRAWFWVTLTAGVAVVATVVGLGITIGTQTQPTTPTDEYLGPFDVMFPRPTP